jgi:glyoxylase-like metal-dependent hydrolase (beta-lactamase superfamily II)
MEIAPGIHRIESDLGARSMAQYLLVGTERSLLVDTGLSGTPAAVLVPYLESVGLHDGPDLVLISHADVDHCGGNRALRARFGRALFACHERDRAWVQSNEAMLAGNYLWYEEYGFGPDADARSFIAAELGGDAPIDLGLSGGEVLHLGDGWELEVIALPGHTPGHVGLWDPRSRAAIVVDAVLERGVRDRAGELRIPPRIYDTQGYHDSIERIRALRPELLLTAHFPVLEREQAEGFLDRSLQHDVRLQAIVSEGLAAGERDLWALTQRADAQLGPYPEFTIELAAAVRDHARRAGVTLPRR